MPPKTSDRAAGSNPPVGNLKPLLLRDASGRTAAAKAARRPQVPTHVTGTTNHAQHHAPRNAQS